MTDLSDCAHGVEGCKCLAYMTAERDAYKNGNHSIHNENQALRLTLVSLRKMLRFKDWEIMRLHRERDEALLQAELYRSGFDGYDNP